MKKPKRKKAIMAWAVINKRGNIYGGFSPWIYRSKKWAIRACSEGQKPRRVRIEVVR